MVAVDLFIKSDRRDDGDSSASQMVGLCIRSVPWNLCQPADARWES